MIPNLAELQILNVPHSIFATMKPKRNLIIFVVTKVSFVVFLELKITRKVEYALIALRHLQQNGRGELCSAKTLSLEYGIPQELLAKILQKLSKENIILSVKGPKGGYKISKDPNTYDRIKLINSTIPRLKEVTKKVLENISKI